MIEYRNLIVNSKISLVEKLNKKHKDFYIYCRSKFAAATIKILEENGYIIKGVIDDNKSFVKKNFL